MGRLRFKEKRDLPSFVRAEPSVGVGRPDFWSRSSCGGKLSHQNPGVLSDTRFYSSGKGGLRELVLPRGALTGLGRSPKPKGRRGSQSLFLAA